MSHEAESLIAVVDDDDRVCRALSRVLGFHGYQVRTFTSARAYLEARQRMTPSCVVADVRMPELDGFSLYEMERAAGGSVPTVFITASGDVATTVRAMKAGATDFLEKPFDDRALLAAVEQAVERSAHGASERRSLAELWWHLDRLTPREAEVCAHVVAGRLNKQVAAALGTTEKTVKVHRARVMQKMGAASLAELVRLVDRALRESTADRIVTEAGETIAQPRAIAIIARVLGRSAVDGEVRPELKPILAQLAATPVSDERQHTVRIMDQGAMPR